MPRSRALEDAPIRRRAERRLAPPGMPAGVSRATRLVLWLVASVAGAALFWLVQVLTGGPTITHFMGEQIAEAGGYPARLAPGIGWAVHLGVSAAYAGLFGLIALVLATTARGPAPVLVGLLVALALGWVTAVVAPPAISVTIGVLSAQGWPAELFPPNTELGLPFWNHLAFFLLSWLVQALGPALAQRP